MKHIKLFSVLGAIFVPAISFAALSGLRELITAVGKILSSLIPILLGLALVYFFWGIGQFILKEAGNEKAREEGKKKIMWGVIAIFVMVSIWGILAFIGNIFGIQVNVSYGNLPARTIQQNLDLTLPSGGGGI